MNALPELNLSPFTLPYRPDTFPTAAVSATQCRLSGRHRAAPGTPAALRPAPDSRRAPTRLLQRAVSAFRRPAAAPPAAGPAAAVSPLSLLLAANYRGLGNGPDPAALDGPTLQRQRAALVGPLRNLSTAVGSLMTLEQQIARLARLPAGGQPGAGGMPDMAALSRIAEGARCLAGIRAGGIRWFQWATDGNEAVERFAIDHAADSAAWEEAARALRAVVLQARGLRASLGRLPGMAVAPQVP